MEDQTQTTPAESQQVSSPQRQVKQFSKPLTIVVVLVFLLMAGELIYLSYQNYLL